jgi:hypothetical protein
MQQNTDSLVSPDGSGTPIDVPDTLNRESISSLTMEIRRSLEYYFNQTPKAPPIVQGILSTSDKNLQALSGILSRALNIRIDMAAIPQTWAATPDIASAIVFPEGLGYVGATGVAMRNLAGIPANIPSFSLIPRAKDEGRIQDVRRRLVFALVASVATIIFGVFISFNMGYQANIVEGELKQKNEALVGLQRIKQTRLESILKQNALQQSLQQKGFPIPRIMDAIGKSLAPQSSLVDITLNADGRIVLTGEATTEKSIIETLNSLKTNAFLEDALLESFGKSVDNKVGALERFQITCRLIGVSHAAPKVQ